MGKSFRIIASEKDTVDMDLYKTNKQTHTHKHTHTHTHTNTQNNVSDIPTLTKPSRIHASKAYSIRDPCIYIIKK
jgi:hypothetical protein